MNCTPQSLIEVSKCYDCIPPGMQGAVQTMLSCEWANASGQLCDDPVVVDWINRINMNGIPLPSDDTIRAVCDFCEALRLTGIMDKMLVVNPIIPDTLLAMRYPLIYQVGNGNSPWINSGFVATDLDNNGIQNVAAVAIQYMDTGFSPSTHWGLDPSNGGMSIYMSDFSGGIPANEIELGSDDDAPGLNSFYMSCWDPAIGNFSESCWTTPVGFVGAETPAFYSLNRTSTTRADVYQANTAIPFHTVLTDLIDQSLRDPPLLSLYFMALHDSTGTASFSTKRVSFVAVHEPLTATEAQDFYEAVYSLRFDLGGGYI